MPELTTRLIEISKHVSTQGVFWLSDDNLYGAVNGDLVVRPIATNVQLASASNLDIVRCCFKMMPHLPVDAIVYVGNKAIRIFRPNIVIVLDKGAEFAKSINRSVRRILDRCETKTIKTESSTNTP